MFTQGARALPVITDSRQMVPVLAKWRSALRQAVRTALPAPTPFNFQAKGIRGGIQLTWGKVGETKAIGQLGETAAAGPDGYEILRSLSGDFSSDLIVIPIRDSKQTQYVDNVGGAVTTCSYRIRATSGTAEQPHSVKGQDSGTVKASSIDSSDTVTVPTTVFDTYTNDATRAGARYGRYNTL